MSHPNHSFGTFPLILKKDVCNYRLVCQSCVRDHYVTEGYAYYSCMLGLFHLSYDPFRFLFLSAYFSVKTNLPQADDQHLQDTVSETISFLFCSVDIIMKKRIFLIIFNAQLQYLNSFEPNDQRIQIVLLHCFCFSKMF